MERSAIRENLTEATAPDFAPLHPGYANDFLNNAG
jgi:hypothetical protein